MSNFFIGLLIGIAIGRLLDFWVDWKYPRASKTKEEKDND